MDADESRFERVPLTEWRRLRATLAEFCSDVAVERTTESGTDPDDSGDSEESERIICQFGRATFAVSRAGDVEAGMPLHGFTASGVEAVGVDAASGELLVETAESRYVFRRP
jgi:hypothetical protein